MATPPIQPPREQPRNNAVITEKAAQSAKIAFLRDSQHNIASKMGQVEGDLEQAKARLLAKQQAELDKQKDKAAGNCSDISCAPAPACSTAQSLSLASFEFVDSGSQSRLYFDPLGSQFDICSPCTDDVELIGSCVDDDDAGCCIDDGDDGCDTDCDTDDLYQRQLAQIAEAMNSGYGDVHGKQQELAALQALHRLAVSDTDSAEQQMSNFIQQNRDDVDENGMNLLAQTGVLASA